jgi:hypothetical protein
MPKHSGNISADAKRVKLPPTKDESSQDRFESNMGAEIKNKNADTDEFSDLESSVLAEEIANGDVTDEQLSPNEHQVNIGKDYYLLLKKMEDYAQDLAGLVVRYFKEKDLEARKYLILKSAEVLKLNPKPKSGSFRSR